MSLLKISALEAFYGKTQALFQIDLSLAKGEAAAVLGANGAGKTTLLRAICAMVRSRGEVLMDGQSLMGLSTEQIACRGVAHVPQGRGTFMGLSTVENLQLGAAVRHDREGVAEDMERVYGWFPRLAERRGQQAGTLSGGEQQMLAVGRALMSRPRLLLLDEPSFGLAPRVIEELFAVLTRVRQETGVSMLIVEQNARQALELASSAFLLETGQVVLSGTASELREHDGVRRAYLGY